MQSLLRPGSCSIGQYSVIKDQSAHIRKGIKRNCDRHNIEDLSDGFIRRNDEGR